MLEGVLIGFFFLQAEDGIRDLVRSRGLGDVYKRQECDKDIAEWRSKSPDCRLVLYTSGTDMPAYTGSELSLIHI